MFKHTLSLSLSATLVASLGAQTLTVDPIIITATKSEQSQSTLTANINVITADEIEEKHYTTVAEAINSLPGISITSSGGLGSTQDIYLRGMENSKTLVLINGIRYQNPSSTTGAQFSHLMISDIERIEVIKGAQSGIWGSDASAGVINIITKTAQDGTRSGVTLEKGSFGTNKWGGYVSHKTGIYDLKLAVERIMSDSFTTVAPYGTDIDNYEKDPYANTTLNLIGHVRPTATDTVEVLYTDISALSNYDTSTSLPNSTQHSDVKTQLYGITYDKKLGQHTLSVKTNLSQFKRDEVDTTSASSVKVFNGQTTQIELNDQFHYRENDLLVAGISKETFDVDYVKGNGGVNTDTTTSHAAYLTNSNTMKDLILTESLRRDNYSNFGGKTTGKAGAKYTILKDLFVSINYGTAYTSPNLMQIMNPWGTPNTNLKPENSKSFDATIGYKNFTATYFTNHVKDLIQWNAGVYENLDGTSTFKGCELAYKGKILDDLLGSAGYTYLTSFDNQQGQELKRRPKEDAKFALDYYGIHKWHLGLNGEYVGTRYNSDNRAGAQTGCYSLFGAVVNYDLSNSIQLYAKIDNITNKYYQSVDGYATSPQSWYLGLKASF